METTDGGKEAHIFSNMTSEEPETVEDLTANNKKQMDHIMANKSRLEIHKKRLVDDNTDLPLASARAMEEGTTELSNQSATISEQQPQLTLEVADLAKQTDPLEKEFCSELEKSYSEIVAELLSVTAKLDATRDDLGSIIDEQRLERAELLSTTDDLLQTQLEVSLTNNKLITALGTMRSEPWRKIYYDWCLAGGNDGKARKAAQQLSSMDRQLRKAQEDLAQEQTEKARLQSANAAMQAANTRLEQARNNMRKENHVLKEEIVKLEGKALHEEMKQVKSDLAAKDAEIKVLKAQMLASIIEQADTGTNKSQEDQGITFTIPENADGKSFEIQALRLLRYVKKATTELSDHVKKLQGSQTGMGWDVVMRLENSVESMKTGFDKAIKDVTELKHDE